MTTLSRLRQAEAGIEPSCSIAGNRKGLHLKPVPSALPEVSATLYQPCNLAATRSEKWPRMVENILHRYAISDKLL